LKLAHSQVPSSLRNGYPQAEALKERAEKGEELLPEQKEKVDGIAALEEELKQLSL
jgi:hypothetical protein